MTSAEIGQSVIIQKTADYVCDVLADDATGHDWWHIHRVRQLALRIGRDEEANLFVVELAALLHDIADWKFHDGDETLGPRRASAWLAGQGVDPTTIDHVAEIVARVSFKGAGVATPMRSLEGNVVQDADRLDALGAIGIARTFAYGAHAGNPIHTPDAAPVQHESFAAYKSAKGTTINHFYEKLLLLADRMNTDTGRVLAKQRHAFMEQFLERFFAEWDGEA
jgi:uncharacterized protein